MSLYIDSAARSALGPLLASGIFAGVTTNPAVLDRAGYATADRARLAQDLLRAGAGRVFVQLVGATEQALMDDAVRLAAAFRQPLSHPANEAADATASQPADADATASQPACAGAGAAAFRQPLSHPADEAADAGAAASQPVSQTADAPAVSAIVFKVPATGPGYRALGRVRELGHPILLTAVYHPAQALAAAASGAVAYIAPYLGRMCDQGIDGETAVRQIDAICRRADPPIETLVASVRDLDQVGRLAAQDVPSFTLPLALAEALVNHPPSVAAAAEFDKVAGVG
ncbi:MAG: hypothetical protein LBE08_09875 [Bifidobacteriaceae bacterium]|nr:hypothetical protein [Bifidobacteriaceae bacterium]